MHSCDKLTSGLSRSDADGGCGGSSQRGDLDMKSKLSAALAVAAAIMLAPAAGRADVLSHSFLPTGMLAVAANSTQSITLTPNTLNPFDPTLGTLVGLTVNFVFVAPPG